MPAKKRLLFFHFDLGVGGAEKVLLNLINNLPTEKYDITLCLLFKSGIRLNDLGPHIRLKWIFNRKPFRGVTRFLQLFSPKFLYKRIYKDNYDVEISYMEGIPARIISGSTNTSSKKFAWIHTDNLRNLKTCFRSRKEAIKCYSKFDKIAFVSKIANDNFKESIKWDQPTEIIHNVVDTKDIKTKGDEPIDLILDSDKINFCIVGRLNYVKSHDRLIEAFSEIPNKNWHLYIVGNGELQTAIEQQVQNLNLTENITLLGFETNPYKYMSRMDAILCSSILEGFSTVATETMVLGIPFITTKCAGMDEILEHGKSGLIVENSVEGLKQGLGDFILNSELRKKLKEGATQRGKHFSLEQGILNFENFING